MTVLRLPSRIGLISSVNDSDSALGLDEAQPIIVIERYNRNVTGE